MQPIKAQVHSTWAPPKVDRTHSGVKATAKKNPHVAQHIIAGHALTGADTVPGTFGIGNKRALKALEITAADRLSKIGNSSAKMDDVITAGNVQYRKNSHWRSLCYLFRYFHFGDLKWYHSRHYYITLSSDTSRHSRNELGGDWKPREDTKIITIASLLPDIFHFIL